MKPMFLSVYGSSMKTEASRTHCYPASCGVGDPIMSEFGHDDADDDHREPHDGRTDQKHRLAANLVNNKLLTVSIRLSLCS